MVTILEENDQDIIFQIQYDDLDKKPVRILGRASDLKNVNDKELIISGMIISLDPDEGSFETLKDIFIRQSRKPGMEILL